MQKLSFAFLPALALGIACSSTTPATASRSTCPTGVTCTAFANDDPEQKI